MEQESNMHPYFQSYRFRQPKRKGRDSNKDHSLEETQMKKMTIVRIEMTMMRVMIPSPQALKESPFDWRTS